MEINVRAVAFQDEGLWIAQCLEYDIVATSESIESLEEAFERALVANICVNVDLGRTGLEGIPPAPQMFEDLFNKSSYGLLKDRHRSKSDASPNISDLRIAEMV